jgi:site-specific DNA-cytosine methylase
MRVLVACEYSGRVRDAFLRHGHDAMSCDLLATEVAGPHYQGSVEDVLGDGWDLMVAHPPCTDLAVSGSRHFSEKIADGRQSAALDFVRLLMAAPIERWCIENPVSVISSAICPPTQIIQPWEYGHGEVKATCFWLHNLPRLMPTNCVEGREQRVHLMPPGPDRWKERSRTFEGVAEAMGNQWGGRRLPSCTSQLDLLADEYRLAQSLTPYYH